MKNLVTVIIPIHNEEKRLSICLNSIINQTYNAIEIILVNDGSTDSSLKICHEYARLDARISILDIDEGGVVRARNLGLKSAKGDYIIYVDSDDWIENNHIEKLVSHMRDKEVDIVCCGMKIEYDNSVAELNQKIPLGVYEGDKLVYDLYTKMLRTGVYGEYGIFPSLCLKIFRKEILESVSYRVDPRIVRGEDAAISYLALLGAKKVMVTDETTYHYWQGNNERRFKRDSESYRYFYLLYKILFDSFAQNKNADMLIKQLKEYVADNMVSLLRDIYDIKLNITDIIFDYSELEGKKIVLYGGGKIGKQTLHKLLSLNLNIEIIGWVDKNYKEKNNRLLQSPDLLINTDFDYLIIAIKAQNLALQIKEELVHIGIKKEKILWKPVQYEIRYE